MSLVYRGDLALYILTIKEFIQLKDSQNHEANFGYEFVLTFSFSFNISLYDLKYLEEW